MNRVFFFFGSWFSLFGMFDREVGNIRSGFQECRIDYSLVVPCEKKCWRIFTLTRSLMTNWQFVRRCLLCEWRRVYNVFSSRNWWGVPWWSPSSCKAHYRCKDFRNENHDRELFQQGLIHRVYRATSLFGSPKRGKKNIQQRLFLSWFSKHSAPILHYFIMVLIHAKNMSCISTVPKFHYALFLALNFFYNKDISRERINKSNLSGAMLFIVIVLALSGLETEAEIYSNEKNT